jgi:hypothetical protein
VGLRGDGEVARLAMLRAEPRRGGVVVAWGKETSGDGRRESRESSGFGAFYSERWLGLPGMDGDAPRRSYRRARGEHREARRAPRARARCASGGSSVWEPSRTTPRVPRGRARLG